ncbi:MAG: hypothetical protein JOZ55_05910 [Alphaproteobacteria bacterium]|nr:hypothetical protein [Alphaproteobacteria bacterium]
MTVFVWVIVAVVALQRAGEVLYARANTRSLLARGAVEYGRGHYPLIVALHAAWLFSLLYFLPEPPRVEWFLLAVFVLLQAARLWIMVSLGPFWTTRVVTLEGEPLVRRGPYRFLRHPNYMVVLLEVAILPLALGEVAVAFVFTLANALLLMVRIQTENRALASRRQVPINTASR